MSDARRYLTGVVLSEQSGAPITNAVVIASVGTGTNRRDLGRGKTGSDGRFSVRLDEESLTGKGPVRLRVERADLELELAYGSQSVVNLARLPADHNLWARTPLSRGHRPAGAVEHDHYVFGSIQHVDGSVPTMSGLYVTAEAVGLATTTPIGPSSGTVTPTDGFYVIPLDESAAGKHVRVRVLVAQEGDDLLLGASRVFANCPSNPRIDILLTREEARGKAQYEVVQEAVEAALAAAEEELGEEGDPPTAGHLKAGHLMFIASTQGVEVGSLGNYEVAVRISAALSTPSGTDVRDWTEYVFGLVSVGWPKTAAELLGRPWATVEPALVKAFKKGFITAAAMEDEPLAGFEAVWEHSQVARAVAGDGDTDGDASFWPVLKAAGLDTDEARTLVGLFLGHSGTTGAFWTALGAHGTLGAKAAAVQRAYKVGAVVRGHGPLIARAIDELSGGDLSLLADWSSEDWGDLIDEVVADDKPGWPSSYTGESARLDYITDLMQDVEAAFPARRAATALRLGTGLPSGLYGDFSTAHADIVSYLGMHTDLDLGGAPVAGTDSTSQKLRQMQRLYRVAPTASRSEVTLRLFSEPGLRSARDIASRGKRRFKEQATALGLSADQALEVFQRSRNLSSMASVVASIIHPSLRQGFAYGLTSVIGAPSGDGAPDVATLFGSQDTCACEPCLSVTSPAAYLVDLLHWLDERDGWLSTDSPPISGLADRRPDLGELPLSCENTFRVLPYLDLVNEILEDGVAGQTLPPSPEAGDTGGSTDPYTPTAPTSGRSTTLSAEELLVTPEHRRYEAYQRLAAAETAYYSHSLPHHQDNAEQRAFLSLLGLDRTALLELAGASTDAIANDELGLCEGDVALITGDQHGARRWGFFGDTTDAGAVSEGIDSVSGLRVFRDRSGLDLEQILELLWCRAANPLSGSPSVELLRVRLDPECTLDASLIRHTTSAESTAGDTTPSADQMARLSVFLRASRALGGSLLHADRVLAMLGVTDALSLDQTALTGLGLVKRLSRQLQLDAEVVASFFGTIDTHEDRDAATRPQRCLYDRLFMDARRFPNATPDATGEEWAFVLNPDRDELEISDVELPEVPPPLTDHLVTLAAAFRCSLAELGDAVAWAGDDLDLTLVNLSAVHRRVALAAALRRPVRQVRQLVGLLGPEGGAPSEDWIFADPSAMVTFVDEVRRLGDLGVDLNTVLYLIAHEERAVTSLQPGVVATKRALGELRDTLRGLVSEYDLSAEPSTLSRPELEAALSALLKVADLGADAPAAALLVEAAEGSWYSTTGTTQQDRWDELIAALIDEDDDASRPLLNLLDLRELRAQLFGGDASTPRLLDGDAETQRYAWVWANLLWGQFRAERREAMRAAAAAQLTDLLGRVGRFANRIRELELSVAWPRVTDHADLDYECVDVFLTRAFLALDSVDPEHPYDDLEAPGAALALGALAGAFDAWHALHKAATWLTALGANEDEEEALLSVRDPEEDPPVSVGEALGLPDPGAFPAAAVTDPRQGYQAVRAGLRLMAGLDRIAGQTPTRAEILLALDTPAELEAALVQRLELDAAELSALTGSAWYTGASDGAIEDLWRLLDALDLQRKAGLDAERTVLWLTVETDAPVADASEEQAISARDAASAKAGDPSAWVARARPVRDALRERQRTALLAWLLERGDSPFADADAVYEHYLIDVSMGSWLTTSRVQLALASVQLYVQRLLMGLEPDGVTLDDDDRDEWAWMKNYRVWEAARKIFLYPENWTDPELRDDESGFYESLRSDLSQGALDDDQVEDAALAYLERLRDVASMRMLTYTRETESVDDEDIDRTHVLARTRGEPRQYYYRRWDDQSTWTPWEEVDIGVEGDNCLLVVYARRLMLFWITFEEQGETDEEEGTKKKWYNIRLNWSERKNDQWTPRRTSSDAIDTSDDDDTEDGLDPTGMYESKRHYSLYTTETSGGRLRVKVLLREDDYMIRQFTLDPSSWEVSVGSKSDEIEDNRTPVLDVWYQGYRSADTLTSTLDGEDGPYYLPLAPGASAASDSNNWTTMLTDSEHRMYLFVSRDDQNFAFRTPFFVELDRRPYLVYPSSAAPSVPALATTTNSISLGDLGSFSALGAGTDPSSGDDLDTDIEFSTTGGTVGTRSRTRLSRTLDRSTSFQGNSLATGLKKQYKFEVFHHPYVSDFTKEVRLNGIFGLLNPSETGDASDLARQLLEGDTDAFEASYTPVATYVPDPYPVDTIDFASTGAYASYNWELFFHLPWLVASRLRTEARFEEALDWLHCIFDPRSQNDGYPVPDRFWKFKPFLEPTEPNPTSWGAFTGQASGDTAQIESFEQQVAAWRADPFNPHLLARLRAGTYPKAIFMAYLDTLIAWGDHLFEQDTRESLQEATQLYVLASHLLGDRPASLPATERPDPSTYNSLRDSLDDMSNALYTLENYLPEPKGYAQGGRFQRGLRLGASGAMSVALYPVFCVPPNPRLLGYWDTVEDRLHKIRSGLNLAGERRSLDLFAPPIDPGALVAARAGGQGVQSAVAASAPSLPNHRFSVMHGRATALAGSVRALGGALLSALEKRDGEALSLLRQAHEGTMLKAVEALRKQQVEEAEAQIAALEASQSMAEQRRDYYQGLLDAGLSAWEKTQFVLSTLSARGSLKAAGLQALGAVVALYPEVAVGLAARLATGGPHLEGAISSAAGARSTVASVTGQAAGMAGTMGSYARRTDEWTQQVTQADGEIAQIKSQKDAANLRLDIAKKELKNHQLQREQSAEIERWLKSKYTNQSLYQWMCNTTAGLYFSAYKLAVDLARQAEVCYRYELGVPSSSFIQYGHWDSLRKGLMAGERLSADLERLDAAYLAGDSREFELVKHVSLAQLDPFALVNLQTVGECWVDLPEAIFDLDCPGHYFRRLQAVTVSLACVSGPQANVNVELTLHRSRVRREADFNADLVIDAGGDTQRIVTSSARDDGGLFQLDLRDPRYLPFERLGAISTWRVRMCNTTLRQLDWSSITDMTLHLRYTARYDEDLRDDVLGDQAGGLTGIAGGYTAGSDGPVDARSEGLLLASSARRDQPDAWYAATQAHASSVTFTLGTGLLPAFATAAGVTVALSHVHVLVLGAAPTAGSAIAPVGGDTATLAFAAWGDTGAVLATTDGFSADPWPEDLTVTLTGVTLNNAADVIVLLEYNVTVS